MPENPMSAALDAPTVEEVVVTGKRRKKRKPLEGLLSNPLSLLQGAQDAGARFRNYVASGRADQDVSRLAKDPVGSVVRGGKAVAEGFAEDFKEHPVKTVAGLVPFVGGALSALDTSALRDQAEEARQRGDESAARRLEELAAISSATIAAGVLPGGRAVGKAGVRAIKNAAERDVVRDVSKLTEKYGLEPPKVQRDNPGGDWLKYERERAAERAADNSASGNFARNAPAGAVTGYLDRPVLLDPQKLQDIPGAMRESPGPGNPKYDRLLPSMSERGYDAEAGGPIMIGVSHTGEPFILEGNNRAAVARALGIPAIPAEVRYYAGGEGLEGAMSPERLAEYLYKAPTEQVSAPAIIRSESGAARRAPSAGLDREKLRERYPDPAPPEQKWDKNKGRFYEGKGSDTPEIQALTKARQQATADIKAGNYTPIFDVSKRDYVDPADYPLAGSTLIDTLPKKEATVLAHTEKAQDPAALRRLEEGFLAQQGNPDAEHWYAMLQLQQAYMQMYGPEEGRRRFKKYFADSMAGTTGGADPATNFLSTGYLNHLDLTGTPTPLKGYEIPYPIGGGKHGAMGNIVLGRKFMDSPELFTTAGNPKRFNFKGNFLGHRDKATIDEQMMGAWDPTGKMAQPTYYGLYEQPVHDLAAKYGVAPANFQDVTWAGLKTAKTPNFKPQPMISIINEAVERTSRILGISPDEALQHILSGGPVYAKGGLVEADHA